MTRQRGLALVSVLWGVAILSLIAAAMLSASVTAAHVDRNTWDAARAGTIADEVVDRAILSLLDARAARQPRVDAVPTTLAADGIPVRLWIQDESGRINLNFAEKDVLKNLFVSVGVAGGDAGALAERIVARRGSDVAPNAHIAFRAVDEVLTVPGMSRALFARVEPALTVYGRSGRVSDQVAPREVLRTLPNMDEQAIDRLLKLRDERNALRPTDANVLGSPVGMADTFFVITVEARVDTARVARMAAVQFTGDAARPYLVLAWR